MFGSIGMPELIIILVIALIIFGPRKLPELGKSLGRSLNEFKKASTDLQNTLEQEIKIEEQKEAAAKAKARREDRVSGLRYGPTAIDTDKKDDDQNTAPPRETVSAFVDRGSRSISKSEPKRRRAEPAGEAGRVLAVWRRRGAGRRRPDDVPRASRRAAQAHHARRRRVARRLHHRVRVHQSGLRFRLSAAGRRPCPAAS